jgi:hypothetical protein
MKKNLKEETDQKMVLTTIKYIYIIIKDVKLFGVKATQSFQKTM